MESFTIDLLNDMTGKSDIRPMYRSILDGLNSIDVDLHWSYADPDQQNLVNADPDPGQIQDKTLLNFFRTFFKSKEYFFSSNLYHNLRDKLLFLVSDLKNIISYKNTHKIFG